MLNAILKPDFGSENIYIFYSFIRDFHKIDAQIERVLSLTGQNRKQKEIFGVGNDAFVA